MTLEHYERVEFRRKPAEARSWASPVSALPRVGDQSYVAQFLDALRNDYPRSGREQQVAFQSRPPVSHKIKATSSGD